MRCYKCNSVLDSNNDYCLKCGADVSVYKVVVRASNSYYNEGLAKARVRDLTGAISCLKTSISINKNNIKARNLLGLIYFEMGEVVMALSEWVVSKNIKPDRNVAEVYIKKVQNNPNKLDAMNQAIRRFNNSLAYAKEGNGDIALIQLKKVVALNPKLIKAHLLLGLLQWQEGHKEKAKRSFYNVLKIDRNNTLALRYIDELESNADKTEVDTEAIFRKNRKTPESLSGHDVIIPPNSYKEPSNGIFTVLSILLGVVIGAALVRYLILPAKISSVNYDNNKLVLQYSEQLSASAVDLANMQNQVDALTTERNNLNVRLSGYEEDAKMYSLLIEAAKRYIAGDIASTMIGLSEIDVASLPSQTAKDVYNTMAIACNSGADRFYAQGEKAYRDMNYVDAINYLTAALIYDDTDDDAAFYLALAYSKSEGKVVGIEKFTWFITEYPDSEHFDDIYGRRDILQAELDAELSSEEGTKEGE